jgi:predicted negative regulator of RcsB-dependent stress response
MAYDLEEQEQLAELKAWWNKYGNLTTWVLIVALGAYAGVTFWNNHRAGVASQAAQLYEELQKANFGKDSAKVQRVAADLEDKFAGTTYAQMGALAAAKSAYEANDAKAAKAQLQWVVDHGSNDEYKAVAALRLSGVLLDEKAYDDALKLLSGNFPPAFAANVEDRKGDILVAQNKLAEARAAYQAALDKMDQKNPGRQLVQLKLDAIGGAPAKNAA